MKKTGLISLFIIIVLITIYIVARFLPTCDLVGSWGRGTIKECQCAGIKITVENSLPVDGEMRTVCVGISSSK